MHQRRPTRKAASERAKLKATRDLNIVARHKEGPAPKAIAVELDCDPRIVGRVIEAVGRKRNDTKTPEPELREAEAEPTAPADPAGGELVRDCTLTITGVPGAARAYDRALDLARVIVRREPSHAVTVLDSAGTVLVTIDAAHLAAVRAAKVRKAPTQPRDPTTGPDRKRAMVAAMCMRSEGASARELITVTGWRGCPWGWTIGTNSKGTGLADRCGYGFREEKVGDEVRYFLTPTA